VRALLLPLEQVVQRHQQLREFLRRGDFFENEANVSPAIQPRMWIPEWIPFISSTSHSDRMIDLSPARGGKVGQVIDFNDSMSVRRLVDPSVFKHLGRYW